MEANKAEVFPLDISYSVTLTFSDNTTLTGEQLALRQTRAGLYQGCAGEIRVPLETGSKLR